MILIIDMFPRQAVELLKVRKKKKVTGTISVFAASLSRPLRDLQVLPVHLGLQEEYLDSME